MSYFGTKDYNLEVLMGNVTGHAMMFVAGHDTALTTTRTTLHPTGTTANIDQSGISATPATVDVASTDANDTSAGTGVRTVLLIGLDALGAIQTEIITMNGQTEVTSANTYSAVNGLRSASWGSTTWNEGTLWVGNGSFSSGIPATKYFSMNAVFNKALTSYFVVPTDKTMYLRQITLMVSTSNKDVEIYIEQSSNGINWFTEAVLGMEPSEFNVSILGVPGLVGGTHFRMEALSSGASTDVTAIMACELVDDEL